MKITIQVTEEIETPSTQHCGLCRFQGSAACTAFPTKYFRWRVLKWDSKAKSYRRCKQCKDAEVKP